MAYGIFTHTARETIHLSTIEEAHSTVKALAHRVSHIIQHGGNNDTLLCMYQDGDKLTAVSPENMIGSLGTAVKSLKLEEKGIDPDLIGMHSLRAGGAMALKLHGKSNTIIMKKQQ
eukprot:5014007-Ditylum_brightwellii.AAC.1